MNLSIKICLIRRRPQKSKENKGSHKNLSNRLSNGVYFCTSFIELVALFSVNATDCFFEHSYTLSMKKNKLMKTRGKRALNSLCPDRNLRTKTDDMRHKQTKINNLFTIKMLNPTVT